MRHLPLILGHRGASHDAPQNTVAAFALARSMGADGVELDTSLTRDGVPVVIHDLTLDKTTDGSGPVRALDLAAIKALDAGIRFGERFRGERIPTLDEAFEAVGPDLWVNVELKAEGWHTDGLEWAVLKVIQRHQAAGRVIVSSFNPFTLRRFRALSPQMLIGYLYSPDEPLYLRERWLMAGVWYEALHPHHSLITPEYMLRARLVKKQVNAWTVDDPDRMLALRDLGVNAIITNRPDVAIQTLRRAP
ncbi:MAG TPA: glycerophosphodiester phosphodiesterase family protein [Aggregatilineales bacterium]|nr:glycerophosphodiester phosphodiesterase family protein [Aggregatilineales bacterium]